AHAARLARRQKIVVARWIVDLLRSVNVLGRGRVPGLDGMGDLREIGFLGGIVVISKIFWLVLANIIQQRLRRSSENHFNVGLAGRIAVHRRSYRSCDIAYPL